MSKPTSQASGSYIVRDKRGAYMSAYSQQLGEIKARAWASRLRKAFKRSSLFSQWGR